MGVYYSAWLMASVNVGAEVGYCYLWTMCKMLASKQSR